MLRLNKDTIAFFGDFNTFGKPLMGIEKFDLDSGKLQGRSTNFTGVATDVFYDSISKSTYLLGDLGYVMALEASVNLIRVDVNGEVDDQFVFAFTDFKDIKSKFKSVTKLGDTLYCTGSFSKVNNTEVEGIVGINCKTLKVFTLSVKPIDYNFTAVGIAQHLCLMNKLITINGEVFANFVALDRKTLKPITTWETSVTEQPLTVTENKDNIFIHGENELNGWLAGNLDIVSTDFKKQVIPTGWFDPSSTIQKVVSDGSGGYFISGALKLFNYKAVDRVVHLDSSGKLDTLFKYLSDRIPEDMARIGDTLILIYTPQVELKSGAGYNNLWLYNIKSKIFYKSAAKVSPWQTPKLKSWKNKLVIQGLDAVNGMANYGPVIIDLKTNALEYTPFNASPYLEVNEALDEIVTPQASLWSEGYKVSGYLQLDYSDPIPKKFKTEINGQVEVMEPDGKGGYYMSGQSVIGRVRSSSTAAEIFHILADGTLDPTFRFKHDGYGIKHLKLMGNELYAAGSIRKDDPYLYDWVVVDPVSGNYLYHPTKEFSNVSCLEKMSDSTLLLGGSFWFSTDSSKQYLSVYNTKSHTVMPWNSGLSGGVVGATELTDSFLYVFGTFKTHKSKPIANLIRYKRYPSLQFDANWAVNTSGTFVYAHGLDAIDSILYVRGFCHKTDNCLVNGLQWTSHVALNLNTLVADTLNLAPNAGISALIKFKDSLLIGGGSLGNGSTLISYDLSQQKVNKWNSGLNAPVKQIVVKGDSILTAIGDGTVYSEQGEFGRFDMNTRRLIPTKSIDYEVVEVGGLLAFQPSEKYLFTLKSQKFVYNNDTFHGLIKHDLLGIPLQWNPEIGQLEKVEGMLNFVGSLVVFGPAANPITAGEYLVISLDVETGKRNKPILHYLGMVNNLLDLDGKLAVLGTMGVRLGTKTVTTKFAKNFTKADTNYVLDYDQLLAVEKTDDGHYLGILETDSTAGIYHANFVGKTRLLATLTNNGNPQIFSFLNYDSTLYFSADAQLAKSAASSTIMTGNGVYSINSRSLLFGKNINATLAPVVLHKQEKNTALITSNNTMNLLEPIRNQSVTFFNKSTGIYGLLKDKIQIKNLYSSIGSRGALYLDNLIVANCQVVDIANDSAIKLGMLNTKSGLLIDAMPVLPTNSAVYDMEVIGDTLFVSGNINGNLGTGEKVTHLFGWSIKDQKVVWNPVIDGIVHEIHYDSLFDELIFCGQFTKVKGEARKYVSSIKVNNLQLKSQTKWSGVNQLVYEINISGSYIILAGTAINYKNQGAILIDRASGKTIDLEGVPSQVWSGTMIENYLLLSTQNRVYVVDLTSGLPSNFMGDLGLSNYRMEVVDSTLWTIGSRRNQTHLSTGYVSEIILQEGLTKPVITKVEPKTIAVVRESTIEVFGYQLDSTKSVYLVNGKDTLQPIFGTTNISKNGRRLEARFALDLADTGYYQVFLRMNDSSSLISKDSVLAEKPFFGYSECSVVGSESIRANEAYVYQFKVVNHSNFDRFFIPITVLSSAKSNLEFMGSGFDTSIYSYKESGVLTSWGSAKNIRYRSMVIPKLLASETFTFYAKIIPTGNEDIYLDLIAQTPIHFFDSSSSVHLISAYDKLVSGIDTVLASDSLAKKVDRINATFKVNPLDKQDLMPIHYFLKDWLDSAGGDFTDFDINLTKSLSNDTNYFGNFMGSQKSNLANSPWQPFNTFLQQPIKIEVVNSYDPNKKVGTSGFEGSHYTGSLPNQIPFVIHFENDSSATAPLQYLQISDTIDVDVFDPQSIRFSNIMVGDVMLEVELNSTAIDQMFDLRSSFNIYLSVKTDYNPTTHILTWRFWALHPTELSKTGLGATQGFLLPHKDGNNGRGFVSFQIDVRLTAENLDNTASIIFDKNEPILTNTWQLRVDKTPPVSRVDQSGVLKTSKSFEVEWSGFDSGIGVKHFDIYVSTDSKNYEVWLKETTNTKAIFTADMPGPHFFYSIATDNTLNRETKLTFDAEYFVIEKPEDHVLVFPNPASDKRVKVVTDFDGDIKIETYGSTGNLLQSKTGEANEIQFIHFVNPGLYFIVVQNSMGERFTKKVMVL